ncbi:DeoR family transcriptional regulator [Patescibacteria group bacterium]|nr:DeoR family transcriptional regulator [Patescibacteria group bacterium]
MITERQEKLLNFLVKEYISTAKTVSSKALKKVTDLDVSAATIRNDLQVLTKEGFIEQPHISAGRVPTKKAYRYFADKIASQGEKTFSTFIFQEIRITRGQINEELKLAEELMKSLSEASSALSISRPTEKDDLFEILSMMGPARTIYQKNMTIINEIIKELEDF